MGLIEVLFLRITGDKKCNFPFLPRSIIRSGLEALPQLTCKERLQWLERLSNKVHQHSSFPVIHKVGNVVIFVLLCSEG